MIADFLRRIYLRLLGSYRLPSLIAREVTGRRRILDVGCGRASPLGLIGMDSYKVGLDFYQPYILTSRESSIHHDYILGDVRLLPFKPKSFDCALATEVLEHLTRQEGPEMIRQMEEVAGKIILTTPNGFLPTYPGPQDNPDEEHRCGWTVSELTGLGFKVYGLGGWKQLWKVDAGQAVIRFRPRKVFALLAGVTELLVYRHPSLAFSLFCVKEKLDD